MILAVNIGNTNTAVWLSDGEWVKRMRVPTAAYESADGFLASLELPDGIAGAVVASVSPAKTDAVASALEALTGRPPLRVESAADCGLDLSAYDASLLGVDRILCCVGALTEYPPPVAVFDLGTAISISVVGADRRFLGGAILPGLRLGLDALSGGTALLPGVELTGNAPLIGDNTARCMQSGAVYGAAGAIDGYARRLRKALGEKATFVVTGGGAETVLPHCLEEFHLRPALLMDGLVRIYSTSR